MNDRFIKYIETNRLLATGDRVLLAVSGGIDSVVLATLFRQSSYQFGMAHCNFQLRGKDSENDEAFVKSLAGEMQVQFDSRKFNTILYAKQQKMSVQMAARDLRYAYFEDVRVREGYDVIATAHHLDDSIETLFINILRGTGVSGLKGIPKKNNKIIRPLLFASKDDIETFAKLNHLPHIVDHSNKEEKYLRNKIRHRLLPLLRDINPSLNKSMELFFDHMATAEAIISETINNYKNICFRCRENEQQIIIKELLQLPHPKALLYEFLKEYGFNASQSDDVFGSINKQPGKVFLSTTHKLISDREMLIIVPASNLKRETQEILIQPDTLTAAYGKWKFIFEHGYIHDDGLKLPENAEIMLADYEKLHFPLVLRPWKHGDSMVMLGMKGKKKVSDILIDEKIPIHNKEETMVLCSGDEIVWLVGLRIAEGIKITKKTKKYFMARLH